MIRTTERRMELYDSRTTERRMELYDSTTERRMKLYDDNTTKTNFIVSLFRGNFLFFATISRKWLSISIRCSVVGFPYFVNVKEEIKLIAKMVFLYQ